MGSGPGRRSACQPSHGGDAGSPGRCHCGRAADAAFAGGMGAPASGCPGLRPRVRSPSRPPGWPRKPPEPLAWKPSPAPRKTPATSTCLPGRKVATAAPWAGPSTASCKASTCSPARGCQKPARPRPQPRACSAKKTSSRRSAGLRCRSDFVQRAARRPHWREVYVGIPYRRRRPRGLHRPALPGRRRPGHRRLQDRHLEDPGRP